MKIKLFLIGLLFGTLINSSYAQNDSTSGADWFGITGSFGASVIRNELSPNYILDFRYLKEEKYAIKLGLHGNYIFEKNTGGTYSTFSYPFLTSTFMKYQSRDKNWMGGGLGILLPSISNAQRGPHFSKGTMKFYYTYSTKYVELAGELYFINNFKAAFVLPATTISPFDISATAAKTLLPP